MSLPVIIVYELPERNVSQQHIKQRRNDSKTHDSLACNGRAISSELLISWDFIRYCPRRLNNTQKGSNQTKEKYIHTHESSSSVTTLKFSSTLSPPAVLTCFCVESATLFVVRARFVRDRTRVLALARWLVRIGPRSTP